MGASSVWWRQWHVGFSEFTGGNRRKSLCLWSIGPYVGEGPAEVNPQAFTRAYNGANGHVIWSSRSPVGSAGGASFASGNQVFVVLRQGNSQILHLHDFTQENSRQILRSYNAVTGAKLWERVIDPKKSVGPMKVNGNQLFLAGSTNTGGNYGTRLCRAV